MLYYNHQKDKQTLFKRERGNGMKNLLKKLVLSVLVACTVITAIPVTNVQAADVKPYMKQKFIKTYDVTKTSAETFIKDVHKYGKLGIKSKVHLCFKLKAKGKSYDDAVKKIDKFARKVENSKSNTYGIPMGTEYDEANYEYAKWDKKSKTLTIPCYINSFNEIIYTEQMIANALKQKTFDIWGYDKNKNYTQITVYTKDIFPNKAAFKKASDSVKIQFVNSYLGKYAMQTSHHDGYSFGFSYEYVSKNKTSGDCVQFRIMYMNVARMIVHLEEGISSVTGKQDNSKLNVCYPLDFDHANHSMMTCWIKNSYGTYDLFEGNNKDFRTLSYNRKYTDEISYMNLYYKNKTLKGEGAMTAHTFQDSFKKLEKYMNGKKNSELFNICYEILQSY